MGKTILILGGYGGVGKPLARLILQNTEVELIIAGRNQQAADEFATLLQKDYPDRMVLSSYADAKNIESLKKAFAGVDLVIISATVPEYIQEVATAALDANCDYIDILFQSDVILQLEPFTAEIQAKNRFFITQGGFHPGLMAPLIRYASTFFDQIEKATVGMTMNARFNTPVSAKELIAESYDFQSEIWKDGQWRIQSYRDALKIDFGERYGTKSCMAMQMDELKPLPEELGIAEMGVYVSGFNWFVDNVVFSLVYLAGKIKKGLWSGFFQWLFKWGMDTFSPPEEYLVFRLDASGVKDGKKKKLTLFAKHDDGYYVTAACVLGLLYQYWQGKFKDPGLYLMGNIVDPHQLIGDLKDIGIEFE